MKQRCYSIVLAITDLKDTMRVHVSMCVHMHVRERELVHHDLVTKMQL